MAKQKMKRQLHGTKLTNTNILSHITNVIHQFREYNFRDLFTKCGYGVPGAFDPSRAYTDKVLNGNDEEREDGDADDAYELGSGVGADVVEE